VDNLRLILIVLGLIILAAIVLFHRPKGQSQPNHARWRQSRREPSLGESDTGQTGPGAPEPDDDSADCEAVRQSSFPAFARETVRAQAAATKAAGTTEAVRPALDKDNKVPLPPVSPDKIITLYIRRRKERQIGGSDLLDAAVKAGLSFGEMNIFHRRQEGADKPLFSMANLTPPGHFDASAWNVFDTPGVALFATLPGPVSGLDTWDAMLATGTRIAELLDADLLDDGKCRLTRQRIAQIREELRDYDRLHGSGSA
jgi:cell division protein ZipA